MKNKKISVDVEKYRKYANALKEIIEYCNTKTVIEEEADEGIDRAKNKIKSILSKHLK